MHLAHLRLRDFRNYPRLDVEFGPGLHVLEGSNAQGKTNVLEAIYLLATLRSFRGVGGGQMIGHGATGYFVGGTVVGASISEIKAYWSMKERKLTLNGVPVKRLSDYFGVLRAVVFCSEDLMLVKGTSPVRRRFIDLLLAQTSPGYLPILQRYTQALRSRNALLKQRVVNEEELAGFTQPLVDAGNRIMEARRAIIPKISPLARLAFRRVAVDRDEVKLEYIPNVKGDFAVTLVNQRERERVLRTTICGPHRDDLGLVVNDYAAGQFTSEGQKRTLAIALKMAQSEYLSGLNGSPPVLLIDDVMGELDASRREGFLPLLQHAKRAGGQVFMTCTERNWSHELSASATLWKVSRGQLLQE